jgi:hypothetical protein
MKSLKHILCSLTLLCAFTGITFSQSDTQTQTDQGAKSDVKEAGQATARAAKKTAHKTKRGAKKATHAAAKKTRQGAGKVEDKTQTPPPPPPQ